MVQFLILWEQCPWLTSLSETKKERGKTKQTTATATRERGGKERERGEKEREKGELRGRFISVPVAS